MVAVSGCVRNHWDLVEEKKKGRNGGAVLSYGAVIGMGEMLSAAKETMTMQAKAESLEMYYRNIEYIKATIFQLYNTARSMSTA